MGTEVCNFCEMETDFLSESFQPDHNELGWWCDDCDGFTYFSEEKNCHRFTLILEKNCTAKHMIKLEGIKFSKRLSPYRYPGGKSKVIDYLYTHMQKQKSDILISPFTGGGSFELAMLESGMIKQLHLNDLDYGVYALWRVIKERPEDITYLLKNHSPSHEDFFFARKIIQSEYKGVGLLEAAWSSLLVNRLAYSGISKANPLGGRKGEREKLLSRWNPSDLNNRMMKIHSMGDRIHVTRENGMDLIEESYWLDKATIFIDPPYVSKGKALYDQFFTEKDHVSLAVQLDLLHQGCPGADIVLTYDYSEWLENLYHFPLMKEVGRVYSA